MTVFVKKKKKKPYLSQKNIAETSETSTSKKTLGPFPICSLARQGYWSNLIYNCEKLRSQFYSMQIFDTDYPENIKQSD